MHARDKVQAFFEERQRHFKEYSFSKTVQSTAKTLKSQGFNLVTFTHIVVEFWNGENAQRKDELIVLFVSKVQSLLSEISEKEIAEIEEARKFEEEKATKLKAKSENNLSITEASNKEFQHQNLPVKIGENVAEISRDFAKLKTNVEAQIELVKSHGTEGSMKLSSEKIANIHNCSFPLIEIGNAKVQEIETAEREKIYVKGIAKGTEKRKEKQIQKQKEKEKKQSEKIRIMEADEEKKKEKKKFGTGECALTVTETFTCISALDEYLKRAAKYVKEGFVSSRKMLLNPMVQLFAGARSALAEGIRKAGAPIEHQKAVLEMLMTALNETPIGGLASVAGVIKNSSAGARCLMREFLDINWWIVS